MKNGVGGGGAPGLAVGTKVEVCRGYDARWVRGFEVAEVEPSCYRLRRLSDRSLLPGAFSADEIRSEDNLRRPWF